jgi:uncharacterized protein with NRDE domain
LKQQLFSALDFRLQIVGGVNMCLIVFAYKVHPRYELVMAGNRDEFYARPTAFLHRWEDHPRVFAGRDLERMGTWLGITAEGRFAAVTNFREGNPPPESVLSRGDLVRAYLTGEASPREYMEEVARTAADYSGFNLLAGNPEHLFYFSNRSSLIRELTPGVYGLSNHLLDTPWPKVTRALSSFKKVVAKSDAVSIRHIIDILTSREKVPDEALPNTGVDPAWERVLAPAFITSPTYGTRSSSVLLIDRKGEVVFHEQAWQPARNAPVPAGERCFRFKRAVNGDQ